MLYVRLARALEPTACVRPIDAAQGLHYAVLDRLGIAIIVRVISGAPVLGSNPQTSPLDNWRQCFEPNRDPEGVSVLVIM